MAAAMKPGDVDGEDAEDMEDDGESLDRRVAALEEENRGLRELLEAREGQRGVGKEGGRAGRGQASVRPCRNG